MRFPSLCAIRSAPAALGAPAAESFEPSEGRNKLANLPPELLIYMLSFLPAVDLANAAVVFETSNMLPSICQDWQLWRRHTLPAIPELPPPPTNASWQKQWRACPRPLQISILQDSLNVNVASRHEINSWRLGAANHSMAVTYVYESSRGDERHNHAEQFAYAVRFSTRHDTQPPSQYFARYAQALLDKGCTYLGAAALDRVHSTLDEVETYFDAYKVPLPQSAVESFVRKCHTAGLQDAEESARAASRLLTINADR